jgi:hypothetical protein
MHENASTVTSKLVNAQGLLQVLFEPDARPSLRWLRNQTKAKSIPFVRCGRLIFFYPPDVRAALDKKHTVRSKHERKLQEVTA